MVDVTKLKAFIHTEHWTQGPMGQVTICDDRGTDIVHVLETEDGVSRAHKIVCAWKVIFVLRNDLKEI